jgi:signal transduction histidine kinase
MLKENLAFNRADRISAVGRATLAVTTFAAALVDTPQPAVFAPYVIGILTAYALVSIAIAAVIWKRPLSKPPIGHWVHVIDLMVFAALVYLTGGVASPFFPVYLFAILSATLRWDWRGALGTSAAIIVLFVPTAFFDTAGLDPGRDDVLRFVVRIGQIIVVGGLLVYIGLQRERYWQELLLLSRPVDAPAGPVADVIDTCLDHVRDFFGVSSALFLWEMRDEPGWRIARRGEGPALSALPTPAWSGPVFDTLTGSTFDFRAGAGDCRRYASDGELVTVPHPLLDPALAEAWGVDEAVIASISSDALSGWLVIPKRVTEVDLYLARALSVQLAAAVDNAVATETWLAAAASEERVRVAHDLHDGILQFLTGLALQLRLIERQVTTDPEGVLQRIHTVTSALRQEQQDLRRFVEGIRPHRAPIPDVGQPLSDLVPMLAEQWDIGINVEITNEPPANLAAEVRLIVRESVANAVRHGKARRMKICSKTDDAGYHLSVDDDGGGFGTDGRFTVAMLRDSGTGPVSILDRVERLGAALMLDTSNRGSRLEMFFPRIGNTPA